MKKAISKAPNLDEEFKNNLLARVEFLIDGFEVSVCNRLVEDRLHKTIYVNGVLKGVWFGTNNEHEENKRFAYSSEHYVHSKKHRDQYEKLAKLVGRDLGHNTKIEKRVFCATVSLKTIIKQWCGRDINKSIELIDKDGNVLYKYK